MQTKVGSLAEKVQREGTAPHLPWSQALVPGEGPESIQPPLNSAASTGNFFMGPACAASLSPSPRRREQGRQVDLGLGDPDLDTSEGTSLRPLLWEDGQGF